MARVVDESRQLVADMGMRPYRIFSVLEVWDGGEPGRGAMTREEVEWTPTPKLDISSLNREFRAAGSVERGTVRLRGVSPRMTEDEIMRRCGCDAREGARAIIEARSTVSATRRFVVAGAPYLDAERFEWVVPLRAQNAPAQVRRRAP